MPRQFLQNLEPRQLLAAGALDATFGMGGATAVRIEPGLTIGSVHPLPGGKLLTATSSAGTLNFFRLNADGSFDMLFGSEGRLSERFSSNGRETAVDSTGRIAVLGSGEVAVYLPDGTPDTSVGGDGIIHLTQLSASEEEHLAFTSDGKLVVAVATGAPEIQMVRFNADGSPDETFYAGDVRKIAGERLDGLAVGGDGTIFLATHFFTTADNDGVEEPVSHVQIHRIEPDGLNFTVAGIGGGLDNPSVRVKDLEPAPDGSVTALVYDLNANQDSYVYSVRRYAPIGAAEIQNYPLNLPATGSALEAELASNGQTLVTGYDQQNLWFAQRYTTGGNLDPSYGQLGTAWPNLPAPAANYTGDATVLDDGSVVIANTRTRGQDESPTIVFAKIAGGDGAPIDLRLNARGTLILYATAGNDHIALYIRGRDGRLMVRSDDFVKSFAPSRVKRIAIFAGAGDDTVTIGTGVRGSYVQGDDGNDTLTGGDFTDILLGSAGNDSLTGGLAPDRMFGEDGNDILYGNGGRDFMWGGNGNDDLFGNGHDDTLNGEAGDDRLFGGGGGDNVAGGIGIDSAAQDPLDTYSGDIESLV